jgi:hypothetical protein
MRVVPPIVLLVAICVLGAFQYWDHRMIEDQLQAIPTGFPSISCPTPHVTSEHVDTTALEQKIEAVDQNVHELRQRLWQHRQRMEHLGG